jgi:hypothetical protein
MEIQQQAMLALCPQLANSVLSGETSFHLAGRRPIGTSPGTFFFRFTLTRPA